MSCNIILEEDNDSIVLSEESLKLPSSAPGYKYKRWIIAESGKPHPQVCPTCGNVRSRFPIGPFKLRKKEFDLSTTYDGYLVVSGKLRSFLESEFDLDLFVPIPEQTGFYIFDHFRLPVIAVDREKSGIRESELCPSCGEPFHQLFGRIPGRPPTIHPLVFEDSPGFLSRSDMEFGTAHGRSPVVVTNAHSSEKLKAQDFKGLSFERADG